MNKPILNVRVLSPQAILYQGQALSVSSKNLLGNFDILPEHANMITFTQDSPIHIRDKDKTTTFKFPMAIIFVTQNRVTIYSQPELVKI